MSYKITAKVYQTNQNGFFHIVEKTCWKYGGVTWGEVNGTHVLTMDSSGSSGSLRFVSDTGENFIVTLGVHDNKRWGDIVTNLTDEQTGVVVTSEYYDSESPYRVAQRNNQLPTYSVANNRGRTFWFTYTVTNGHNLVVNIVIG
jgi:Fungal fruit body lectin